MLLPLVQLPAQPGQVVVLAISVVVPFLGVAQFVAGQDHRHPLREHERGDEVAFLLFPQEAMMAGSSDGPSTPQFQLLLSSVPSRFSSSLSSLCLLL